jgi:hypothetical protein
MLKTLLIVASTFCIVTASQAVHAGNFCKHGGKQYSIHSTRCEDGNRLRCVSADTWKRIAACNSK